MKMITSKFQTMTIQNLSRSKENSGEMPDWHRKLENENNADNCIKISLN